MTNKKSTNLIWGILLGVVLGILFGMWLGPTMLKIEWVGTQFLNSRDLMEKMFCIFQESLGHDNMQRGN